MTRTHEQFIEELKEIDSTIEVVGRYERVTDRIAVRCAACEGALSLQRGADHFSGRCHQDSSEGTCNL